MKCKPSTKARTIDKNSLTMERLPYLLGQKQSGVARLLRLRILALGLTAPCVQFALLRELMGAYGGNEYLVGLALASWLLFGGLASLLARWRPPGELIPSPLERWLWAAMAWAPLLSILALRWARHRLFLTGAGLGLSTQLAVTAFAQLPFCSLSAYLLVRNAQRLALDKKEFGIGQSYLWDAIGSLAGGALFALVLSPLLGHLQIAGVVAAVLTAFALPVPFERFPATFQRLLGWGALGGLSLIAGLLGERLSLGWLIPAGHLVFEARSPYGQIVVSELGGQRTYLRNGAPLFSTDTPEIVEQFVHLPMLLHSSPKQVLVVGAPRREVWQAIQQHHVIEVTFVQPDPALDKALRACGDFASDPNVRVICDDARRFLSVNPPLYDVVLVDEGLPTTLLANRYFTREFARLARSALKPGGLIALPLGEYTDYFDQPRAQLIASVCRAFESEFPHVRLLAADYVTLVAAQHSLAADLSSQFEQRAPRTAYVRPTYIAATVAAPDRIASLNRVRSMPALMNSDSFPIASRFVLQRWMNEYGSHVGVVETCLIVAVLVFVLRMRRVQWPVFIAGFSASGLEYVALAMVQTFAGTLYYLSTFFITLFMAGLAVGVIWAQRLQARPKVIVRAILTFACLAAAQGLFILEVPDLPHVLNRIALPIPGIQLWFIASVFGLLLLAQGALTAIVFALCSRVEEIDLAQRTSRLYAADFVGGALGAGLFAIFLVPTLGMVVPSVVCALFLLVASLGPSSRRGRHG